VKRYKRILRLPAGDAAGVQSELDEELASHVQLRVDEMTRAGVDPVTARLRAEAELQHVQHYVDRIIAEDLMRVERTQRMRWLTDFRDDLVHAVRGLARQKIWALGVILVLALGVAVNAAIFSLVDAVLFRGLDAVRANELVRVFSPGEGDDETMGTSYPLYLDYRDQSRQLAGVAAVADARPVNVVIAGRAAEQVRATIASGTYFRVLGTRQELGRLMGPDDDRPGQSGVVVLSYSYWQRAFGGDTDVTGQVLSLNRVPFTIIGVAPRNFTGIAFDQASDLWVPMAAAHIAAPGLVMLAPLERRGFSWLNVVARVKPGVSPAQVEAELSGIANSPAQRANRPLRARVVPASEATIDAAAAGSAARLSLILLGAVLLVILLACADVAALLLARAEHRRREFAVRLALGAGRGRLLRQFAVESLTLMVGAGIAGLAVAFVFRRALIALAPADFPVPFLSATPLLDTRVIAFTALLGLVTVFLFGALPAFAISRIDANALRGRDPKSHVPGVRVSARDVMVVVQLALSLIFLTGAALLARSVKKASELDLGFARTGVITARFDLSRNGYDRARAEVFLAALLEKLRSAPGVHAAALASHPTVDNHGMSTSAAYEGHVYPNDDAMPSVDVNLVTPDYLKAVGTTLLRGRQFTNADVEQSTPVVIVSRALADKYWPGQDAIGKHIGALSTPPAEVVGIVANAKYRTLRESPRPFVLMPVAQFYVSNLSVVMRSDLSRAAAQRLVEQSVAELDPNVPVFAVATVEEHLRAAFAQERLVAVLLASLSALGLLLSSTGLFALISFLVKSRAREWGIRMAIGARPADVLRLVQLRSVRLAIAGLVVGMAGALVLTRYLQGLLFEVERTDPLSYATAAGVLFAVALAAGYYPARVATRTDPGITLRSE
jgi:putative ABC transport system permease protein